MPTDFPAGPNDHLFATIPEVTLFGRQHTPEQLAYLVKWCACPCCGDKPVSLDPLPEGWAWDEIAFTTWAWCPVCMAKTEATEEG